MTPTVGRIVQYTLTKDDAEQINRRRTDGASIAERIKAAIWPIGAQAHIGNEASEGQVCAMVIVRVWSDTCVNGQVLLDGNDVFWACSRSPGEGAGKWAWPARTP